ncbi:MAG: hypothetical protein ACREFQ_23175, partial [Stellaceae bacterium]
YYAREDWLPQHKDAARRFMQVVIAAAKKLSADPALYRAGLVEDFKVPKPLAAILPLDIHNVDFVTEPADYQAVIDGLVRAKVLAQPMPAKDVIFPITP